MDKKINLVPPAGVRNAAKRGIQLVADGKAGDGFEPATLARARKIAAGQELTPAHVKRMYSFFRRHSVDRKPDWGKAGGETPGYVAWMAWGGDAGASWSSMKVAQMKRANMSEEENNDMSEDDNKREERIDDAVDLVLDAWGGKPGTNFKQVDPEARRRLRGLMEYYAKKPHPFRACVRDNRKRFGPNAERVCAVLKDLIRGTTKWRGKSDMSEMGMFSEYAATEGVEATLVDEVPVIDEEIASILLDMDDAIMAQVESLLWDEA